MSKQKLFIHPEAGSNGNKQRREVTKTSFPTLYKLLETNIGAISEAFKQGKVLEVIPGSSEVLDNLKKEFVKYRISAEGLEVHLEINHIPYRFCYVSFGIERKPSVTVLPAKPLKEKPKYWIKVQEAEVLEADDSTDIKKTLLNLNITAPECIDGGDCQACPGHDLCVDINAAKNLDDVYDIYVKHQEGKYEK